MNRSKKIFLCSCLALSILLMYCLKSDDFTTFSVFRPFTLDTVDTSETAGNTLFSIDRITQTFYGDPSTQKAFTWYAPADYQNQLVLEVTKQGTNDVIDFSSAISYPEEVGNASYDASFCWHKTVASNLAPDTHYFYRIGDPLTQKWSQVGEFETSGEKDCFSFVALTDTQGENIEDYTFSADTLQKSLNICPEAAFFLHSGDIVNNGGIEEEWVQLLNTGSDIFRNHTIVPTAGDHEDATQAFYEHFNLLPATQSSIQNGVYYSFDYSFAHFVVLNTNDTSNTCTALSEDQLAWLQQDITSAKEKGAKWIIVSMHKGPYTIGPHASAAEFTAPNGIRTVLPPIFEELTVDLVLQGHDHTPSTTKPLGGVVYTATGEAGVKTYPKCTTLFKEYLNCFRFISLDERAAATYQNFAVITLSTSSLEYTLYEVNTSISREVPAILDHFVLKK